MSQLINFKGVVCSDQGYPPSTRFSSGVMVAHFIPTLYFLTASAASTVTEEKSFTS